MSIIGKVAKFIFEKRGQAPGQSMNVKTIESGKFARETEFYQLPGFVGGVTPGSQCVIQEIEGGYSVIVASNNYKLSVSVTAGQTKIYSTDATGTTKKAEILLDTNGKVKLFNSDESLKGLIYDLIAEIVALKTFGTPANHTVDPSSVTNLNAIKTRFGNLLF